MGVAMVVSASGWNWYAGGGGPDGLANTTDG